ncbi:unnamed protein product [Linum trigynum]|uniref:TF-B3 domain-containing protein n=1 Tax=Linum trigynum TaxID=586398 RepID=A0AAV2EU14_9ROSI
MERPCKSFFRVILPDSLKKLELPLKFARMHGEELRKNCRIYLPNGTFLKVGVTKGQQTGEICLDKGWPNFVEENSVSIGCFLVFDYLGSSKFQVQILKIPAAYEIVDPSQFNVKDESLDHDKDSVQILGSSLPTPTKKRGSGLPAKRKYADQIVDEDGNRAMLNDLKAKQIFVSRLFICTIRKMSGESKKALEEAMAAAEQPRLVPCFIVVMQRHNIAPGAPLNVPAQFVKEHMGSGDCKKNVALCCKEKNWNAETVPRGGSGLWINEGWRELMEFEKLKEGDVCLFQKLTTRDGIALKVSVFRGSQLSSGK